MMRGNDVIRSRHWALRCIVQEAAKKHRRHAQIFGLRLTFQPPGLFFSTFGIRLEFKFGNSDPGGGVTSIGR